MRKVLATFYCLLFFMPQRGWVQTPKQSNSMLPQIMGASPEASGMERFVSYPVNMFSGLPQISIPLYTIEINGLKVPISLQYHASGFRVTDDASWVGLGWSLVAGGTISRKVAGYADEQLGYLNGSYPIRVSGIDNRTDADISYLRDVNERRIDTEPDIYSYSLPSASGKFYFGRRSVNQPVFIPFQPIRLLTQIIDNNLFFRLLDETGVEYRFGSSRESSTPSGGRTSVSAWPVDFIISRDKQDTISFTYESDSYIGGEDVLDFIRVVDNVTSVPDTRPGTPPVRYTPGITRTSTLQSSTISGLKLRVINFRNGRIVFQRSASNRLDINTSRSLERVMIFSKDPLTGALLPIRTIELQTGYFLKGVSNPMPFKLKLDEVRILDRNNKVVEQYRFDYRANLFIADGINVLKARDYWGYYNARNNDILVPRQTIQLNGSGGIESSTTTIGSSLANGRDPDSVYNQLFILTRMHLPTGGFTEFDYETNRYWDQFDNTVKLGGGLRVRRIRFFTGKGQYSHQKSYRYGANESGWGRLIIPIASRLFSTAQFQFPCYDYTGYYCRIRNFGSVPNVSIDPYDGNAVGYEEVTEYEGDESLNNGRTVYRFNFVPDAFSSWYYYGRPNLLSNHFKRGLLREKIIQKRGTNNSWAKVQHTINEYGAFPDNTGDSARLIVFENTIYDQQGACWSYSTEGAKLAPPYEFNSYGILTGDNKLIRTIDTLYDVSGPGRFVQTTEFQYGNFNHHQVTQIRKITPGHPVQVVQKRYAGDLLSDPSLGSVSNQMVAANMVSQVVEEHSLAGSTTKQRTRTIYQNWNAAAGGPPQIAPRTFEYRLGASGTPVVEQINALDRFSNILSMAKDRDVVRTYLWDYQAALPVASITGAAVEDVAYTSFETDGKGGWSFAGFPAIDPNNLPPTGKWVYNLNAGPISRNLKPGLTYTLSFWSKGLPQVQGAGLQFVGRTVGGYTYYQFQTNSGMSSVQISGTILLDEIRLYPHRAQMETFTYEPLVGRTSACDINNRITYYSYDPYNRLVQVQDMDRNIIKQFCYQYNGQTEACRLFGNTTQTRIFSKADCTTCHIGSRVSYTVPANVYLAYSQAAADSLALQDLTANGLLYANLSGTCSLASQGDVIATQNLSSIGSFRIDFLRRCDQQRFSFTLSSNSNRLGSIPEGRYDVTITPGVSGNFIYRISGQLVNVQGGPIFRDLNLTGVTNVFINPGF